MSPTPPMSPTPYSDGFGVEPGVKGYNRESRNWCYRSFFSKSGLRSTVTDLGDGTMMHCWVPKTLKETKPNLVLIHGFGANAMWQWGEIIRFLLPYFNLYVSDLVFFGDSFMTRPDKFESFQAQCVMRVMESNSVKKMSVVGAELWRVRCVQHGGAV
ncbi:hypothetical protein F0562_032684 [Nyssa sinensis]|uniref:AB hydrolase-1 domain-containing protein n=1 Tax=Nyssa sinensis TaxID=561372 RepID=A0A5J5APA8_9ASTE|nr:hypothetical protein F0562_032684 [Nyssa sinensis]